MKAIERTLWLTLGIAIAYAAPLAHWWLWATRWLPEDWRP